MNEESEISFLVGFECKVCSLVLKSAQEYCSHKVEFHFAQLAKSRFILFEESTHTKIQNFERVLPLPNDKTQEITVSRLKDKTRFEVIKQELPGPDPSPVSKAVISSTNSDSTVKNPVNLLALTFTDASGRASIKTEWVEDTVIKSESPQPQNDEHLVGRTNFGSKYHENQEYKPSNIYHETEAQSNFISLDDADLDLSDGRVDVDVDDLGHDPLETVQVARSTFSAKTGSDSDDDIVCLDDPLLPTANKFATSNSNSKIGLLATATPAETETSTERLILSQLKLRCQICSKKFASSAQLRIHATICQLYNGNGESNRKTPTETEAGPSSPQPQPQDMRSCDRDRDRDRDRVRVRVRRRRRPPTGAKTGCSFVNCEECGRGIRRSQLGSHLRTEHKILVQDSDRNWVCHMCDSAFRSNYDLKEHSMVHSNEKPFKCPLPECGREFKYERNLRHHAKSVHPQFN